MYMSLCVEEKCVYNFGKPSCGMFPLKTENNMS